jgi:hypothetical protein
MRNLVVCLLFAASLQAAPLLDEGYRQMYNLQFNLAHQTFATYVQQNPADPMGPVSDAAAYLFGEFDRLRILESQFLTEDENFFRGVHKLNADPAAKQPFEVALAKTQQLADAQLRAKPGDADAMLAQTLRLGLHSDYLALIEKRSMAALSEVKQGRVMAEQLLARHPDYYDAYIAVGLENYLLSQKPAPVRWMLRATGSQTDKQTGVEKIRLTAEKGHYLLPYARLLLAVADLRDHAPQRAKEKLQWLSREFPQNQLYRDELAKLN